MHQRMIGPWTLVCWFLLGACVSPDRDSGGPSDGEVAAEWRLSDSAELVLGSEYGGSSEFGQVAGVVRLENGSIFVADGVKNEVTLFDPNGKAVAIAGRHGSGPGEFQGIYWMKPYRGDSIMVWDAGLSRGTVFDKELTFGRLLVPVPDAAEAFLIPFGTMDDGSVVARAIPPRIVDKGGEAWEQFDIVRISASGKDIAPLFVLDSKRCPRVDMGSCPYPPLGYVSYYAAMGGAIVVANAFSSELQYMDGNGDLVNSIAVNGPTRQVTADDRAKLRGRMREENLPIPKNMPPFLDLRLSEDGDVWVKTDLRNEWSIFDDEGRSIGAIRLIDDLRIEAIDLDHLIGVRRDSLDVESVHVYSLSTSKQ